MSRIERKFPTKEEQLLQDKLDDALGQLFAIKNELDRYSMIDAEFPLAMRVKGLVDRYAALAEFA